ncbi:hypothetical protein Tco_0340713 [Tanacetum coccineum]
MPAMSTVLNEDFVAPPYEEDLLSFLNELGYKGPLDHLARILRQSRVLWGMFYMKNVDCPELIWEDLTFQIDYRQEKLSRREIMLYPRFTKIIINHFLSLNPSIPKGPSSGLHTIKIDGVISRLKFVRIGLILPKKSRGKGSQGKQQAVISKKKVSIFFYDNIIPDPDVAFELGKSMSLTEAEEEEASRQVYATHEWLVTESDLEPARRSTRRRPSSIAFRDTSIESPAEVSHMLEAQVKELVLYQGFPMSPHSSSQPQVKELVLHQGVPDEVKVTSEAKADQQLIVDDEDRKRRLNCVRLGRVIDDRECDAAKADVEKMEEVKDVEINSLLNVQIQQEIPHIQSLSMLTVPVLMIPDPIILSPIPKIPTVIPVTILPPPPLVSVFEKDVKELKQVDHSPAILATIRSKVPAAVDEYLRSSLGDALQNVLQKHTEELIQQSSQKDIFEIIKMKQEQADKKKMPKFSTTPYDQAVEDEFK